jgi:mono/diheme cytochrome c family protein
MPKWIFPTLLCLTLVALLPAALISRARNSHSSTPRINLVPDMDYQPKLLPQTENRMFADGRAMRPRVEGTVARGQLQEDDHLHRGRDAGDWATSIPYPVTQSFVERGRDRFDIYCALCHGSAGFGDGIISARADELAQLGQAVWTPPTSLHDPTVRERPDGHIFNTITHGIRSMPPYGSQIEAADRWAIIAYVRALQRSQNATISDVPEDVRPTLR